MKINITLLIFAVAISTVYTYEDLEGRERRYKFYKDIRRHSNNTIDVEVDPFNGLVCKAMDHINMNEKVLRVNKKLSMCPYYLYPFKFEIVDFLHQVNGLNSTLGREQKFSVYVLVYQIMYHLHADKAYIKNYIEANNLEAYMNLEIDEIVNIENSFPKIILGKSTLDPEHYKLLQEKGLASEGGQELEAVFRNVLFRITQNPHMEALFHWTSNFEDFRHAYGVVMSRGMTLRLNEYATLVSQKEKSGRYNEYEKRNLAINQQICAGAGCPCFVLYVDLCNHHQPTFRDLRDKRAIILDTEKDHFINMSPKDYDMGDELSFTYSNDPNNLVMFLHYGFSMPNNIFNIYRVKVDDPYKWSLTQFNLCKEINCLENSIPEPSKIPATRVHAIQYNQLLDSLVNYARIRMLNTDEFSTQQVIKAIRSKKPISYENELSAWIFYLRKMMTEWNTMKPVYLDSLKNSQIYRRKRREVEAEWKDNEAQRAKWRNLRHFDVIYDIDISFRRIVVNHILGVENKIVKVITDDISSLKSKILSAYTS